MSKGSDGNGEGSCETKVSQFDLSVFINEEILRLQISVNDSLTMAVMKAMKNLIKIRLFYQGVKDKHTLIIN